MAYATVANIEGEFKSITFSPTTSPTDTEVGGFLTQADQEIDATIAVKYLLPIDGANTKALELLKSIEISIVSDRVAAILKVKSSSQKVNQDPKSGRFSNWGRDMLKKITKGTVLLLNPTGTEIDLVTTHDGIESFNVDNNIEHEFDKGVDQW